MARLNNFLILANLLVYCTAAPLVLSLEPRDTLSRRDQLDPKKVFKGIYWDDAERGCTPDQYAILIEATRMADQMTNFLVNTPNWWDSDAWNRYFVRNSQADVGGRWQDGDFTNRPVFAEMYYNVNQVSAKPKKGKPFADGSLIRLRQVAYSCDKPVGLFQSSKCVDSPDENGRWHGPSAQTYEPRLTDNVGWAIEFCPRFFKDGDLRYVNDITKSFKSESSLPMLRSYEWAISHEWMHCRLFGYRKDIRDVRGYDGKQVYGDEASHAFAWYLIHHSYDHRRHINRETVFNADNYAWLYQYHWFKHVFKWGSDGNFAADNVDPGDPIDDEIPVDIAASTDPNREYHDGIPINCTPGPGDPLDGDLGSNSWATGFHCAYVEGEYSELLNNLKLSFTSSGGCQLSSDCHLPFNNGNAVNPSCVCHCGNDLTPLNDERCSGFAGALPNPPGPRGH